MDIYYNIANVADTVNAINENTDFLYDDRVISLKRKIINGIAGQNSLSVLEVQCKSLNNTKYSSSGCYEIIDRINVYLSCICQNLSTIQDIYLNTFKNTYKLNAETTLEQLDTNDSTKDLIDLNASIKDVYSNNITFSLTEYNNTDNVKQTFKLLSSFYAQVGYDPASIKDKSKAILLRQDYESSVFKLSKYHELLNQQNTNITFEADDFTLNLSCSGQSYKSLINAFDIYQLLSMFINRLRNVKNIGLLFFHKRTQKSTVMNAYGIIPEHEHQVTVTGEGLQSYYQNGRNVTITISPYIEQSIPLQEQSIFIVTEKYTRERQKYITDNDNKQLIQLNNILYDVSSGAELLKNITQDIDCTNGIFSNELDITKNDTFKLTLSDVIQLFNIKKNTIINRKTVLKAIDYIFSTWFETMSTITYRIITCHNNCHNNSGEFGVHFKSDVVTSLLYEVGQTQTFFYTGGCGCGNKMSGIYNFLTMVPYARRTSGRLIFGNDQTKEVGGNLYLSYTRTCGTDSPLFIRVNYCTDSGRWIQHETIIKESLIDDTNDLYYLVHPVKKSISVVASNVIKKTDTEYETGNNKHAIRIDMKLDCQNVPAKNLPFTMNVAAYTQYTLLEEKKPDPEPDPEPDPADS